jgi:hypothetical protein
LLRAALPGILAAVPDTLSPRIVPIIEDLRGDWRRLDERIEGLSAEIKVLAHEDSGCERLMTVPGIGPISSSALVAAIGRGDAFSKGRDFAAWLGLVPPERNKLRSKAGYIDARPLTARSTKSSSDARPDHTLGQSRKASNAEPESALHPETDFEVAHHAVCFAPGADVRTDQALW